MIAFLFQPSLHGEKSRLWSTRIRLEEWPRPRTFRLHVTDKRVADQKMRELISELERETHGVGIPKPTREALRIELTVHHAAFLKACEASKLSANTLTKYRHSLPLLFTRCKWTTIRDVTPASFKNWRDHSDLSPKSVNDLLGSMRTFLLWMKRERLILVDPLAEVQKVANTGVGSFRRALSADDVRRLLEKSPIYRATVYLTMIYTGLRRNELNGLKWGDFNFTANPPTLKVPSSLSKNRKESTHYLRPEVVTAVQAIRPQWAQAEHFVFQGQIPRVQTLMKDLAAAGIPFEDARGRRVDIHALRKTFGTLLASSGVSPRVSMELMRHSDMKLTMGVYTDVVQLPIIEETSRLPSFTLPPREEKKGDALLRLKLPAVAIVAQRASQRAAQTGVAEGRELSSSVAQVEMTNVAKPSDTDAFGRKKTPGVATGRFGKMEREKRLELSTSTLARWCSTN